MNDSSVGEKTRYIESKRSASFIIQMVATIGAQLSGLKQVHAKRHHEICTHHLRIIQHRKTATSRCQYLKMQSSSTSAPMKLLKLRHACAALSSGEEREAMVPCCAFGLDVTLPTASSALTCHVRALQRYRQSPFLHQANHPQGSSPPACRSKAILWLCL